MPGDRLYSSRAQRPGPVLGIDLPIDVQQTKLTKRPTPDWRRRQLEQGEGSSTHLRTLQSTRRQDRVTPRPASSIKRPPSSRPPSQAGARSPDDHSPPAHGRHQACHYGNASFISQPSSIIINRWAMPIPVTSTSTGRDIGSSRIDVDCGSDCVPPTGGLRCRAPLGTVPRLRRSLPDFVSTRCATRSTERDELPEVLISCRR